MPSAQGSGLVSNRVGEGERSVDFRVLDRLREQTYDGEIDLVPELIQTFLDEVPSSCDELRGAWSANDPEKIRALAHHLKSTTSSLGAGKMTALCLELELLGRRGDTAQAGALIVELQLELGIVRAAFARYLAGVAASPGNASKEG